MNTKSKLLIFLMIFWPVSLLIAYLIFNGSLLGIFSLVLIIITIEVALFAIYLSQSEGKSEEYTEYEY